MRPLRTPRSAGRFFVTREESLCKNNTVCTKFTTSTFCNKAMSAVAKNLHHHATEVSCGIVLTYFLVLVSSNCDELSFFEDVGSKWTVRQFDNVVAFH